MSRVNIPAEIFLEKKRSRSDEPGKKQFRRLVNRPGGVYIYITRKFGKINVSKAMADAEVTILIPNYKTPEMTRLCLRLLRRHTDLERVQVVVIDNGSGDASLDYLRGVNWIRLIERPEAAKEKGPEMHARALDLALKEVTTPYVLVMHTDTLICNDGWLDFLLGKISGDETVAGVVSWKLEEPPSAFKQFGKKIESLLRRLLGKKTKVEERYLRSHCALYRTELIRKRTNGFFDGDTAGHSLHRMLVQQGYKMRFLESQELGRYLRHLNHATMILNPQPGDRKTSKPSARRRLQRQLDELDYRNVLADSTLDRI